MRYFDTPGTPELVDQVDHVVSALPGAPVRSGPDDSDCQIDLAGAVAAHQLESALAFKSSLLSISCIGGLLNAETTQSPSASSLPVGSLSKTGPRVSHGGALPTVKALEV